MVDAKTTKNNLFRDEKDVTRRLLAKVKVYGLSSMKLQYTRYQADIQSPRR